jgi:hypothetical protein
MTPEATVEAVELLARVALYIEDYEDAPNWGGGSMYRAMLPLADLKALHALASRITPTVSREGQREAIARIIYDANPDIEGSQFSGQYQRSFEDAQSRGFPKVREAHRLAAAILALPAPPQHGEEVA